MSKLRVGLCGLGFMGDTHLAGYANIREAEVVAICHASVRRFAGSTKGNIGGLGSSAAIKQKARRYATLAEMLAAEKLDLVDVCTPTFTHVDLACRALRAGVHVLCEKPLALTVRDCDRMLEAARRSGKFLMAAHCLRWWPEYVLLHDLVRSGKYGRVKSLYLFRGSMPTSWAPWMSDESKSGGPLLDLHIHDLDQVLWLLGRPAAVAASLSRDRRVGSVFYRYPDRVVTVDYNANMAGGFQFNMAYRVQFERATLIFDFMQKPALSLWTAGRLTHPRLKSVNAYEAELRYLLDCVRRGRAPRRLTPREARDCVALGALERKAATTGRWISVPPA